MEDKRKYHIIIGSKAYFDRSLPIFTEDDIKELDKILKDNDEDDNPFELEEQYKWEWLDDTE